MEKKIKLSDKQKEVIKKMREGWKLFSWYDDLTKSRWWQLEGYDAKEQHGYSDRINARVTYNLRMKKLITSVKPHILTELGKSIEL